MRVLISAGGTGGHVFPAVNVSKELEKRGCKLLYIGNKNSLEQKIANESKIDFKAVNIQKLYRYFTLKHIFFPIKLIVSIIKTIFYLNSFKPHCFLGMGGFVAGGVGLAIVIFNLFSFKKIAIILHEQNGYPGISNRLLKRFAVKIFLGNKSAKKFFEKSLYCGNPISQKIVDLKSKNKGEKNLLILGGSQGSITINRVVLKIYKKLLNDGWDIYWQVGKKNIKKMNNKSGIHLFGFTLDMETLYKNAKIAISRCGALSLAELEHMKIPSILIPLPSAASGHQLFNAKDWQKRKIGITLEEKELNEKALLFAIDKINKNYDKFKKRFKISHHTQATKVITNFIVKGEW